MTCRFDSSSIRPVPARKSSWQHEVSQSSLPFNTKGFLLILSVEWMDAAGGSCFPSEAQIMEKARISRPALTGHIRRAVDAGFLEVHHYGHGLKNRRYNYRARLPGDPQPAPVVVEDGKNSFVSSAGDGKDSFHTLTMPNFNHSQEERPADPTPAPETPVAPEPVANLSLPLRSLKTTAPDTLPDSWVIQGRLLRPDLHEATIRKSGAIFLDTARANGRHLVDWQSGFNAWLRRERAPKALQKPHSATEEPSRYRGWVDGVAPICRPLVSQEQAIEMFENHMRRLGAVQDENGLWRRPSAEAAPASCPIPPVPVAPVATAVREVNRLSPQEQLRLAELAAAGCSLAEVAALRGG